MHEPRPSGFVKASCDSRMAKRKKNKRARRREKERRKGKSSTRLPRKVKAQEIASQELEDLGPIDFWTAVSVKSLPLNWFAFALFALPTACNFVTSRDIDSLYFFLMICVCQTLWRLLTRKERVRLQAENDALVRAKMKARQKRRAEKAKQKEQKRLSEELLAARASEKAALVEAERVEAKLDLGHTIEKSGNAPSGTPIAIPIAKE